MNAIAAASSRVLIMLSTAPAMGTPNATSTAGGVFGQRTATVSPLAIPRLRRASARRTHRA
jgi:hypothetical protein